MRACAILLEPNGVCRSGSSRLAHVGGNQLADFEFEPTRPLWFGRAELASFARRYFAAIRNDPPSDRLAVIDPEIRIMTDQLQPPPYVYDGLDPVRESKSIFAEATDVMTGVVTYIADAIERG